MDIAGGLALTATVLMIAALVLPGFMALTRFEATDVILVRVAAILGGFAAVGYIAAIWVAVLS